MKLTLRLEKRILNLEDPGTSVDVSNVVTDTRSDLGDTIETVLRNTSTDTVLKHRIPPMMEARLHRFFNLPQQAQGLFGCHTFVRFLLTDAPFDPHNPSKAIYSPSVEITPSNVSKCRPGDVVAFTVALKKHQTIGPGGRLIPHSQLPEEGFRHSALYIGNGLFLSKLGEEYQVAVSTFEELMNVYRLYGAVQAFKVDCTYL